MKHEEFVLFTLDINAGTLERQPCSIANPDDDAIGMPYKHFLEIDVWHVFIRKDGDISELEAKDRLFQFVNSELGEELVAVSRKILTLNEIFSQRDKP